MSQARLVRGLALPGALRAASSHNDFSVAQVRLRMNVPIENPNTSRTTNDPNTNRIKGDAMAITAKQPLQSQRHWDEHKKRRQVIAMFKNELKGDNARFDDVVDQEKQDAEAYQGCFSRKTTPVMVSAIRKRPAGSVVQGCMRDVEMTISWSMDKRVGTG